MRRLLVVDDDLHICLALRAWLKRYGFRVAIADGGGNGLAALDNATFDLMIVDRKPFGPTTLPGVIDECLSEAEPHRRCVATLAAVASALSEPAESIDDRTSCARGFTA
jgi:DNA-binding NtrC family response regulator